MTTTAETAAAERVARAVRRIQGRRAAISAELVGHLAAEISQLPHDEDMLDLLLASTDESVAAGLYALEQGVDPRILGAPQAAAQYARRIAQRGVPVSALLRSYRLGSSLFVEWVLAELADDPDADPASTAAATVVVLRITTAYVDTVSELLVAAYEHELEAWSQHHSIARASRIAALLEGHDVDVDATEVAIGYRLRQTHLAVQLWFDELGPGADVMRLERAASAAAAVHGGQHLLVLTDEASAALWLAVPEDTEDLGPVVAALTRAQPAPRVALGRPTFGVAGFRASHRQATAARRVVAAGRNGGQATSFAEVGTVALLCADLEATKAWVADTLGPLAADEENAERLRETVRIFLNLGSSHTAAAEQLTLHKNSVQQRVARAEALRGRPFREDRADVELALRACRLLGPAVLGPSP
ncbi:MAG TPA: helix-turn-helix domain-containing protein [Sporichthya sp.]|nr:helix-turn-helix domain-containing protein [Sporichthya sp.]